MATSLSQYATRLRKHECTCSESSRVGTRIKARVTLYEESTVDKVCVDPVSINRSGREQAHRGLTAFVLKIFCRTGMQYAAVFPLPVRALASISRFSRAIGMAFVCTKVGLAKPMSASARRMRESRRWENEEKVDFASASRASTMVDESWSDTPEFPQVHLEKIGHFWTIMRIMI